MVSIFSLGPWVVNKTANKSQIKRRYWFNIIILDIGFCARDHAALICSLFQSKVPVLEYMLVLSVLYSRSWFLFSSTCWSYLFLILDHGSCSRLHVALICSVFQIMVPVLEFMLLLSGINIWKEAFQWTWEAVSAVILLSSPSIIKLSLEQFVAKAKKHSNRPTRISFQNQLFFFFKQ